MSSRVNAVYGVRRPVAGEIAAVLRLAASVEPASISEFSIGNSPLRQPDASTGGTLQDSLGLIVQFGRAAPTST